MARGKLTFKGEAKAKKKKTSSKKKSGEDDNATNINVNNEADVSIGAVGDRSSGSAAAAASSGRSTVSKEASQNEGPQIRTGQGTITTSSTVVQGYGTNFKSELRVGDAILVRNEKGVEEMRVITMFLSPISISLSSAFSSNVKTPSPFKYITKPRNDKKEKAMKIAMARAEKEAIELRAQGTYGGEKEIIYREKTANGGYRIRKEKATTEMSRSDLMAVRAKKKSDRYC